MLSEEQIWTLVIAVFLAISEVLGMVKKGPNGVLHAIWRFYNLKVEVEYDDQDIGSNVGTIVETQGGSGEGVGMGVVSGANVVNK
jgi:hypothetical protein